MAPRLRVGLLAYGLDKPMTGIGRYTVEIARALAARRPEVELLLLQPFPEDIPGLEGLPRIVLLGSRLLPAMMSLGAVELALAAHRHRLDVVHDPIGIAPFFAPNRLARYARVVTIHDMVPFAHPETHARLTNLLFRRYMPWTLRHADYVTTVSDFSRSDIARYFGFDPTRIERVYCGVDRRFTPQPSEALQPVLERYGIAQPYLLTVGALQPRKNLEAVLDAFAHLKSQGLPHRLVIVGPRSWKSLGIFQRLDRLDLGRFVTFTGYVDDADLPAIYAGAACFVFLSIYEGFGLPPLEAMACGTPVVAADTSSIPEVVGDAGLLVAPYDVAGAAQAIARVLADDGVAETLRRRGLIRSQQFTWAAAGDQLIELYREAVRVHASRKSTKAKGSRR